MNPNLPVDQNTISIYLGSAAEVRNRIKTFRDARVTLRKWTLPSYCRKSGFPAYEEQMLLIFHDAEIFDVVMGRALRSEPVDGEQLIERYKREIYDECNFQAYSLIFRSLNMENCGMVDASGAPKYDGHALWEKLVKFNYGINDDSIPFLKQNFYNPLLFRQKKDMTLDTWASEVRMAANVLIANGHQITEKEKILVFRQGLIREDMQHSLILPARTETFEELVESARTIVQSTASSTNARGSSQLVFMTENDSETAYCSYCFEATGRKFFHQVSKCRRKAGIGEFDQHNAQKRPRYNDYLKDITCLNCHQKGHYANRCPNRRERAPLGGRGAGRGGRGQFNRTGGRGGANFVQHNDSSFLNTQESHPGPTTVQQPINAPPPPDFIPPEEYQYFGGVLHNGYLVDQHKTEFQWIFDTGCTTHGAYLASMFKDLKPCEDKMYAANGAAMKIEGCGTAGSISRVLYLPELQANLFSQKQAKREGAKISLSTDGNIFTVVTTEGLTMNFVFDGTFWIWKDAISKEPSNAVVKSTTETVSQLPTLSLSTSFFAHSGAVHQFLLLHFRIGHLNYDAMLRAIKTGAWTGFKHSIKNIHIKELPKCPICLRMKNKHQPVTSVGRYVQLRPGLLFHIDLRTVRTRSINHEYYVLDVIDDNSDKPWVYPLRRKSDALALGLQVFHKTVCLPRGISFYALRLSGQCR
jgi:hypothetical protein